MVFKVVTCDNNFVRHYGEGRSRLTLQERSSEGNTGIDVPRRAKKVGLLVGEYFARSGQQFSVLPDVTIAIYFFVRPL